MQRRTLSGEVKDLALYALTGILIVIALWIFAVHQARTGGSPNLPVKWLGFAGMTAIVFGYTIRGYRRLWRKQSFWLLLGFVFAVHSTVGVFVLLRLQTVPLVLYAALTAIEYAAVAACLNALLQWHS